MTLLSSLGRWFISYRTKLTQRYLVFIIWSLLVGGPGDWIAVAHSKFLFINCHRWLSFYTFSFPHSGFWNNFPNKLVEWKYDFKNALMWSQPNTQFDPTQSHYSRWNLNWRIGSIKLAFGHICEEFFPLRIDVRGSRLQWVALFLSRWVQAV